MALVETSFCPDVERHCTDPEYDPINNLAICHAYEKRQRCRVPERAMAFCIDRYEYPNQRGAHPAWMLTWYKAQATCEAHGKRLCWSSEWTAACEGPAHTPFPYGWERDHTACNMDNFYIEPRRFGPNGQFYFYARDPEIRLDELARLDQSVPSGSMDRCQSGFGVFDLTGNVDEWVTSDQPPRERSQWAALKGGAWGHVRSQCRATTYSHVPEFAYYFVGFRCCRDAEGAPPWTPSPDAVPAPPVEPFDFAPDPVAVERAPGPSRYKFTRLGHRE
jgi:formylglycine-generating enzyme required for sulfatase activity